MDRMPAYFFRKFVDQDKKFKEGKVKESAQHLYWRTLVKTKVYEQYKDETDQILALEGHADIIVSEEPEV